MRFIKKLDIFVLKSFGLLFIGAFFICLFVFMMQFMWRWVEDLIGKGLTLDILAKFFYYSGLTLIPISLPLAVLLAALITFGNFGERFELIAMKSAGVPLTRIIRPLFFFTVLLSIGSFYFQNVTSPEATKNLSTLAYSMKQKSPELEIPEGIFYSEIPGYNIFVEEKGKENGMLYGVMIYSTTEGYENAQIVLSDSARLQTTADEQHLKLTMYAGERFRNMQSQGGLMSRSSVPYMRETFIEETDLIPFNNDFNMMDANLFSGNAQTKNIKEIKHGIDSLEHRSDSVGRSLFKTLRKSTYKRKNKISAEDSTRIASQTLRFDSLFLKLPHETQQRVLKSARQKCSVASNDYEFRSLVSKDIDKSTNVHWVEFYKKFTLSFACIIFFFIGAPLGAIIRKGGLGVPVVTSVAIFIFYYIINASGEDMAKNGAWITWLGVWLSTMILFPIGAFLTYKANKDSVVFNTEAYMNFFRKAFGLRITRNIARKDVIIHDPDYPQVKQELASLIRDWEDYSRKLRLRFPPSYFRIFFRNIIDEEVVGLNNRMEQLITTLSNSKDHALLGGLNKLPVLNAHAHTRPFHNYRWNMLMGIILPLGVFFYFRIWFFRIRLYKDIKQIRKYGLFIIERIDKTTHDNK